MRAPRPNEAVNQNPAVPESAESSGAFSTNAPPAATNRELLALSRNRLQRRQRPKSLANSPRHRRRLSRGLAVNPRGARVRKRKKAPRVGHSANHSLIELGTWRVKRLRRRHIVELYPWTSSDLVASAPAKAQAVNRDPLALARFYESLLESGIVDCRADLARYLGVSRARVTQVLRRLRK
jgi:hypothetical protein